MSKVYAIVVTFHPNIETLHELLNLLSPQVDTILLIDNATPGLAQVVSLSTVDNFELIINSENLGVATAYNQGVVKAQSEGATHTILFDQDSLPADSLVQVLLGVWYKAVQNGMKIAALGPNYTDAKGSCQSPFVGIKGLRL